MAVLMLLSSCMGAGTGNDATDTDTDAQNGTGDTGKVEGDNMIPEQEEEIIVPELTDKDLETVVDSADGAFYDGFVSPDVARKWTVVKGSITKSVTENDELSVKVDYDSGNSAHLSRSFTPSQEFELEFKMRVKTYGAQLLFLMYLGDSRVGVYFYDNTITAVSDGQKYCYATEVGNDWRIYKIRVCEKTAYMYMDGEQILTWKLQADKTGEKSIKFSCGGATDAAEQFYIDYMKYTPTSHVLEWDGIENGKVFTDVRSITLKTKYNRDIKYEGNNITYYVNGAQVGESSKTASFTWNNVKTGAYHIQAKCGNQSTPPIYITVKNGSDGNASASGKVSSQSELLGSYILKYTVSGTGTGTLKAYDGVYSLKIDYSNGKASCLTDNGSISLDSGAGDYIVTVDGGVANLYYAGTFLYSFRMPRATSSDAKVASASGAVSGITVEPFNKTYYSFSGATVKTLDKFGTDYALEFTYTSGTDAKIRLFDSEYFTELIFKGDKLSATVAPWDEAVLCELGAIPQGTNRYRLTVNGGIAMLYVNNVWYASLRLSESIADEYVDISGSTISNVTISSIDDKYFANITFGDDTWKSLLSTGEQTSTVVGNVLKLSETTKANASLLKAYTRDSVTSATVSFDYKSTGAFYLLSRYTSQNYGLCAGYDFAIGQWEILALNSNTVLGKKAASAPMGTVTLKMVVEGNTASLYVDGVLTVSVTNKTIVSYGNVGFATDGVGVGIISFDYEGEGNALSGSMTRSYADFGFGTAGILELSEDKILMSNGSNNYFSDDALETYTAQNKDKFNLSATSYNMIRLKSGKILSLKRTKIGLRYKHQAYIYAADGKTYEGPFTVEKESYQFNAMNARVKQMSSGRIIFVDGCSGAGTTDYTSRCAIYYSDDDGRTWTASQTQFDYATMGIYLSEGTAVELENGVIRLYVRCVTGFLYYTDSYDGGKTWGTDPKPAPFPAVQSAFNVEKDYSTGHIYLAWEYVNANEEGGDRLPRTRVGLAVSADNAKTWQYVGDIDEFSDNYTEGYHWNLGVTVTTNYVFVTLVKKFPKADANNNHVVRIDKKQINALARYTGLHSYSEHRTTPEIIDVILANSLIVTDDKKMYLGKGYYNVNSYSGADTKVKLETLATLVKGSVSGNKITVGAQEYSFDSAEVTLSKAAETLGWRLAEGEHYCILYYHPVEFDSECIIGHTHLR